MLKIRDLGVRLTMNDAGLPMQEPPAPVFPQYYDWTTGRPGCPGGQGGGKGEGGEGGKGKDKDYPKSGGTSKSNKTSKKPGKKARGLGSDAALLLERQLDAHLGNEH